MRINWYQSRFDPWAPGPNEKNEPYKRKGKNEPSGTPVVQRADLLPISMCKLGFMNPTWSPTSEVMNLV
ncbi:hypothetical protein A2U01_0007634 [Trifolium medium]|uniref:Uncharacterized protein n=1 Tax=Trifolium medium TaxID=97028 RepID=A0A392MKI4_9FABA|nr:hypothetical protein [Trifolium medium]